MKTCHATTLLLRAMMCVLSAVATVSCARQKADAAESTSAHTSAIVIAAAWPWARYPDMLYGKGLQLAIDEANREGGLAGRSFSLERIDDNESVDDGRLAAERLVSDGRVSAVVGHMQSYVTVPAAAVYDAAGLPLVAPTSTDASLTSHGYRRVFRTIFTDGDAGRQMAELAAAQRVQRVGIFYIRNEYGRALSNAFESRARALGIDVVGRVSYDPGSSTSAELEQIVRQWGERHIDGVFLGAEAGPAARFAKELQRQRLRVAMFGSDAVGIPTLLREGGVAVEGLMLPAPFHPNDPRVEVQRFVREFTLRNGTAPDVLAALGYDAVRVLTRAMRTAGTSAPDSVSAVLHRMRAWPGVTGPLSFDSTGALVAGRITGVIVRNGAFEYLGDRVAPVTASARD
jgi:branched-chain amino acid transport system substrate-binding protein